MAIDLTQINVGAPGTRTFLNWQGARVEYHGDVTMAQARVIKRATGLTINPLFAGIAEGDPDALVAFVWLILEQNRAEVRQAGVMVIPDIDQLDFSLLDLVGMLEVEVVPLADGEEDPTGTPDGSTPGS